MIILLFITNTLLLILVSLWLYSNWNVYKRNSDYIELNKEKQLEQYNESIERYSNLIEKLDIIIKNISK